jgi:LysM repeat protein
MTERQSCQEMMYHASKPGTPYPKRGLLIALLVIALANASASPVKVSRAQQAQGDGNTLVHVVSWGETLSAIARQYSVDVTAIIQANGLVSDRIYAGQRLIIPGAQSVLPQQQPAVGTHIVQPGETLYHIGLEYGVSTEALLAANDLTDANHLIAGQVLVIPQPGAASDSVVASAANGVHVVARGETLSGLGRRYNVSVSALAAANNLLNPSTIYAGQRLQIPGAATTAEPGYTPIETAQTYTVAAGDTLASIATRYGVSLWVLAQVNDIGNPSLILPGQVLSVPASNALTSPTAATQLGVPSAKAIVVDVSDQRAYVYENGGLKWTFVVSTGLPGADTWRGDFAIQSKLPVAYASTWDLQMPYWLGFYWAGPLQNGFHALPILSNGIRLWAGLLGRPAGRANTLQLGRDRDIGHRSELRTMVQR